MPQILNFNVQNDVYMLDFFFYNNGAYMLDFTNGWKV